MRVKQLWSIVSPCFICDDGSLPEIELKKLSVSEIGDIYSGIRQNSTLVNKEQSFWDIESQSEKNLDEVSNAAILVPERKAEPFHFCVSNFLYCDTKLPCLGFFIFQEEIAIDYRMGVEWGPEQVFTLFSWLKAIVNSTKNGVVTPAANDGPPHPDKFIKAWENFLSP